MGGVPPIECGYVWITCGYIVYVREKMGLAKFLHIASQKSSHHLGSHGHTAYKTNKYVLTTTT